MAVYFIGVWVRAWRWHYLLRPLKKIPTHTMFPVVAIGYFGNNILPATGRGSAARFYPAQARGRARLGFPGDRDRRAHLRRRGHAGFVFINLPELARLTGDAGFMGGINIRDLAIIGVFVFVGALLAFLLAAMFPHVTERIVRWFIERLVPLRLREKTLGLSLRFLSGLGIAALSPGSPDDLRDHRHHLAAGNRQILVCDASLPVRCQLLSH